MGWCSSWWRTFHTEVSSWPAMAGTVSPDTTSSWTTFGSIASGGVPDRVKPSRRVSGGSQVAHPRHPCARRKSTATVLSLLTSCGVRVLLIRRARVHRGSCDASSAVPLRALLGGTLRCTGVFVVEWAEHAVGGMPSVGVVFVDERRHRSSRPARGCLTSEPTAYA